MLADFNTTSTPPTSLTMFHEHNGIFILSARDLETELPNRIKNYGDKDAVETITRLVNEYPSISESSGFV